LISWKGENILEIVQEGVRSLRGGIVDGESVRMKQDMAVDLRKHEGAGRGIVGIVQVYIVVFQCVDDRLD